MTIFNTDTLPAADFDAASPYTLDGVNTRAVKSISFDMITRDGEVAYDYAPERELVEMHTVSGLCPVDANFLSSHNLLTEIKIGESCIDNFPLTGSVTITFNRALDTAAIKAKPDGTIAGLKQKGNDTIVEVTLEFSSDAKILTVRPLLPLKPKAEYVVWIKNIPALDIAGARSINRHGGTFFGRETGNSLTTKGFYTDVN